MIKLGKDGDGEKYDMIVLLVTPLINNRFVFLQSVLTMASHGDLTTRHYQLPFLEMFTWAVNLFSWCFIVGNIGG